MNKSDLIKSAASKSGLSVKDTSVGLTTLLDILRESLESGEPVCLRGFGTFSLRERKARVAYNIATSKLVPIPAVKVVKFKYYRCLTLPSKI